MENTFIYLNVYEIPVEYDTDNKMLKYLLFLFSFVSRDDLRGLLGDLSFPVEVRD